MEEEEIVDIIRTLAVQLEAQVFPTQEAEEEDQAAVVAHVAVVGLE